MEKSGMIRLPNISAGTEAEQLRQIRSYLYQLAEQLQVLLGNTQTEQALTFGEVRTKLLRSAEVMDAIAGIVSRRYDGRYLLQSSWESYALARETMLREAELLARRSDGETKTLSGLLRQLENQEREFLEDPCLMPLSRGNTLTGLELGRRQQQGSYVSYRRLLRLEDGVLTVWNGEGEKILTLRPGAWQLASGEDGHMTIGPLG